MPIGGVRGGCVALFVAICAPVCVAQDYKTTLPAHHPAIAYGSGAVHDAVAELGDKLERGTLADVLRQLRVNADSQMLVFSKTSVQAARISPDNPRAIYFNDEVAVAYVPGASSLEVAAVDPVQGPIFYTVSGDGTGAPNVARSDACLRCHHGPNTAGVPGLYVGSVIPGPGGAPLRDESAIITDHRSAFRERWGGWYVTATRGEQPDRANAVASNPADPEALVRESRQNLRSLAGLIDPSGYLAATSDIVALMTFEHQTQMINLITRVGWEARMTARGPADTPAEQTLAADVEELVSYMVFGGEAALTEPVEGVSTFTRTFPQRGPRDARGRSLRDFDLKTRLFRFPLSYMIYSAAFDALPDAVRDCIYRRLLDVLRGAVPGPAYAHLSADDRRAVFEIVRDTKAGLPTFWIDSPVKW